MEHFGHNGSNPDVSTRVGILEDQVMSHTVIAEFNCHEGIGELFLSGLLPALAETRAFEGCESVETYTDADDPNRIFLWEKWTTRENHEAYLAWRVETGMIDQMAPAMASPARFIHLSRED